MRENFAFGGLRRSARPNPNSGQKRWIPVLAVTQSKRELVSAGITGVVGSDVVQDTRGVKVERDIVQFIPFNPVG